MVLMSWLRLQARRPFGTLAVPGPTHDDTRLPLLLVWNSAMRSFPTALLYALTMISVGGFAAEPQLERIQFNNPGLVVDLGVGLWAWPLPMDYDEDGDWDLVVSCPDKPYNGTYFFENGPGSSVQGPGKNPLALGPRPSTL